MHDTDVRAVLDGAIDDARRNDDRVHLEVEVAERLRDVVLTPDRRRRLQAELQDVASETKETTAHHRYLGDQVALLQEAVVKLAATVDEITREG